MTRAPRVVLIEDKDEDRRQVLAQLADEKFISSREDIVGEPAIYDDALQLIETAADKIDVVFLDLNIPRNEADSRPEKRHGKALLDHIHNANRRPEVNIRVIVVSAEELDDDFYGPLLIQSYDGTLVGVAQKASLKETLTDQLRALSQDPLRNELQRLRVEIVRHYDVAIDSESSIRDRLEEACSLAIRLLRNEMDYTFKRPNASNKHADDLNGLLKALSDRFTADRPGQRAYIKAATITSPGGWGAFLWRGCMAQHLYTLLNYRNDYVHVRSKPFRTDGSGAGEWEIPADLLATVERGEALGQVIDLIVRELLAWYLPWHEQVYLPWIEGHRGGAS